MTDWLIILIMVFIRYVLNTHVEINQMALHISICLADAVQNKIGYCKSKLLRKQLGHRKGRRKLKD